jgi:hypothetical protein
MFNGLISRCWLMLDKYFLGRNFINSTVFIRARCVCFYILTNQWLNLGKDKILTQLLAVCQSRSAKCLSLRICGRPATLGIVIKRRGYCTLHLQPVCNLVACNDARRAWVFVSGIINLDECQRGTLPSLRATSLSVSLSPSAVSCFFWNDQLH